MQSPAVLLTTLVLGVILILSSPGLFFPSASASLQVSGLDTGQPGSGVATRLGPSWNGLQWDWEGMADADGLVGIIVSVPDGLCTDMPALDLENGYSHVMNGYSARVSVDQLDAVMSANPGLQIYPDLPVQAFLSESVTQIGADELWTYTDGQGLPLTGEGIVVAVIDTGVDYTHEDLGGGFGPSYKVIGGYDFYNHDSDPMDDNGHGTHVAGIIAADGDGIKGVAPNAEILAYKTLGKEGQGTMSDVIAAIDRAMDPDQDGDTSDKADIISMSLGGAGEATDPVCLAVARAVEAGIVVVVAAGNDGPQMGTVASPGIAPDAITVGAVDDSGALASFSSRGAAPDFVIKPEISAPGVSIVSTVPYANCAMSSPTGYLAASGTSMATPHVSGGAALLLQMHPDWTPEQVKSALITSAKGIDESIWSAGAGEVWLPAAVETALFPVPAIISCGLAGGEDMTSTVTNKGSYVTVTSYSEDWHALSADGATSFEDWLNLSSVSPSSFSLASGGSSAVTLTVPVPDITEPEGYYDGRIHLSYGSDHLAIPFGFAVLSSLTVHVLDADGNEVFDPYGGVWAYSNPSGDVAMMIRGDSKPAPPASFFLASGEYGVCAAGHQDMYHYDDPYMLSTVVSLERLSNHEIWLSMEDAKEFVLDLETDDGNAIYVQDLRMYFRHEGETNISFHLVGSDYSIIGEELFSLPHSRSVFISETAETVGVSISGFSYTAQMWDFMERNWDHWYEYVSGLSTDFYAEASSDLQYLLAWEFDGIDQSTPVRLGLLDGEYSAYHTKYDIPGELTDIWGDWGSHRSVGGDSAFYIRRDTDTSLNSFFSGMTRTTYVQGVFSELYFPGSLFGGYLEREFYTPDYDHLVKASTVSNIYLPDRNYLTALEPTEEAQRLGSGPYYPSVRTENTDDMLVLYHPLLRDQSGAKVGGTTVPSLNLYKNSMFVGVYQLSEFLSRPDAMRQIALTGAGNYVAKIHYQPNAQICSDVDLELGFAIPSSDSDPPEITSIQMPQRFTPGDTVGLTIAVADESAISSVEISWRDGVEGAWALLPMTTPTDDTYHVDIETSADDSTIDIDIKVTDASGNYLRYTACDACLEEIPVIFEIQAEEQEIGYRNADEAVVIFGALTDAGGSPLHPSGAVPLELTIDGEKVGMILDEYVLSDYHTHDGNIRFEWHFNPTDLFSGPGETIEVQVAFDLGVYEPATRTFALTTVTYESSPPEIMLVSPADGSLISEGTVIDLVVEDEGEVSAEAFLDGSSIGNLEQPWDVSTTGWEDGFHTLRIEATDDSSEEASAAFTFEIDGTEPYVAITCPADGTVVPRGSVLVAQASDEHLVEVTWSLDGGPQSILEDPYEIDMSAWDAGLHTVNVVATDEVGLSSQATTQFEISESTVVVNMLNPDDGGVIRSGVPIEFSVMGTGPFTCRWTNGGSWVTAPEPYTIQTDDWTDGAYTITFNATNELGDSYEVTAVITIDDTAPMMSLLSPAEQAFVTPSDQVDFQITDANFDHVTWTIWGETRSSPYSDVSISLADSPADGYFTIFMTACDAAGNQANDSFTFAMDSQGPTISVDNLPSHGAVAPGSIVEFSVEDAFLAHVIWSLDNGEMSASTAPHSVDLTGMPLGWHVLTIAAFDLAGNERWLNESIYIDGTGPDITILDIEPVQPNSSVEIRAVVSDDFGVSVVTAYYDNEIGTFSQAAMANDGQTYVVTLDANLLRDGMTVYVRATDRTGNTAESDRISLEILAESPEPDDVGDDQEETESGGALLSGSQGLILLGLLLSAGVVILAVAMRSKRKKKASRRPRAAPRRQAVAPARVKASAPRKAQQTRPPARPVGRPIEKPTVMIDANGVVYCKPIRVSQSKMVARPATARQGSRPNTVRIGDHVYVKTSGQPRSRSSSDSRSAPSRRQF